IEIRQVLLRIELREDSMAAIQVHQAVAVTALLATELRMLARRFRGEQEVAALDGDLLRALEMLFGGRQLAHLARDRAEVLFDLTEREAVVRLSRQRERELAGSPRRAVVAAPDRELGAVHLDENARRNVAERIGDLHGFLERAGGVVPALQVRAEHAHVVEGRQ